MRAGAHEVHQISLYRVDEQEVAADMALAMIAPIAFEGVVQPFRAKRRVVGDEEHRSEEHTSELQSLMRISYAVFCLKKKKYSTLKNTTQYISYIPYKTHSQQYRQ